MKILKILAVDSSSATASVAIVEDDKIISESFTNCGLTHSETLAPMVASVLSNSKTDINDIDLFAVCNGPGSFTGLRIGVSIVKALSMVTNKPCVGISPLHALAYNFIDENSFIYSAINSRTNEIYSAVFKSENKVITRLTDDKSVMLDEIVDDFKNLEGDLRFVGDSAIICYDILKSSDKLKVFPIKDRNKFIKASNVAFVAREMKNQNNLSDSYNLPINYLKLSQAERLLKENKLKVGD